MALQNKNKQTNVQKLFKLMTCKYWMLMAACSTSWRGRCCCRSSWTPFQTPPGADPPSPFQPLHDGDAPADLPSPFQNFGDVSRTELIQRRSSPAVAGPPFQNSRADAAAATGPRTSFQNSCEAPFQNSPFCSWRLVSSYSLKYVHFQ
jgi:hypothetical protein